MILFFVISWELYYSSPDCYRSAWEEYRLEGDKVKVLITGATGLIGKELGKSLIRFGAQIVVVSRSAKDARLKLPFPCEIVEGDLTKSPLSLPSDITDVFHLMGENIADSRWNEQVKAKILSTRVNSARNLVASLKGNSNLRLLVSASAVGIYGDQGNEPLDENAKHGEDFLSEVCEKWEAEFEKSDLKCRKVQARVGVVLSRLGGALQKMLTPFQFGVGGCLGSGQQFVSWIHIQDLVNGLLHILKNEELVGPVNLTSPKAVTNRELTKILAEELNTRIGPSVPEIALKLAVGQMAEVLLFSQKVVPKKLIQSGFQFEFADLKKALHDLCSWVKPGEKYFYTEQFIQGSIEKVFEFFSEAKNLERITPEFLNFRIVSMSTDSIQSKTLLKYKLKVHGLPIQWTTEIQTWNPSTLR